MVVKMCLLVIFVMKLEFKITGYRRFKLKKSCMEKKILFLVTIILFNSFFYGCKKKSETIKPVKVDQMELSDMQLKVGKYVSFKLTSDLSVLTSKEKQMLPFLLEAASIMDDLFWEQTLGDKDVFIKYLDCNKDEDLRKFATINYGPWDRLENNVSFIKFCGNKPAGANFYPLNMTTEEFRELKDTNKVNLYTVIRRNSEGKLNVVWFHEEYKEQLNKAADLMKKAANLAEDQGLKQYLLSRATALLTDKYQQSDIDWLNMKTNNIDFVIGPIENYEDALFGYKAAYESFILIKDKKWSARLAKYSTYLPELQKALPVEAKYKKEVPGTDGELNAYDAVYYAGDCNAGSKTIAINLPNNEEIQKTMGSRRLQLKNVMKAKFEKILVPIADVLIDPSQRQFIDFDAFFTNTMFHEVGHGMGIKNVINSKNITVRQALKEQYSALEEGKADIMGLFIITELVKKGEFTDQDLMKNYVTFLASIFRSVRFGASSAHGKANMIRFNYFQEKAAFIRDPKSGKYKVDMENMKLAMNDLLTKILIIQGDGDYQAAKDWVEKDGNIGIVLQFDLKRLTSASIPVDIVFQQGAEVLGLK